MGAPNSGGLSSQIVYYSQFVSFNAKLEELNIARIEERYLVIAYGSNVNPVQLSTKTG